MGWGEMRAVGGGREREGDASHTDQTNGSGSAGWGAAK